MKRSYLFSKYAKMETIHQGQCDDLKFDDGEFRVWVSRCGEGITIEKLSDGQWDTVTKTPEFNTEDL